LLPARRGYKLTIAKHILERWADDEFLIGHHLGIMLHGYLDLEEAVAIGSFAQDELSHASLICDLMNEDERTKDKRFLLREPSQFLCSSLALQPIERWVEVIAKHLLYEEAETLRIEKLDATTVMVREEEYHRKHWWEWASILCKTQPGRRELEATIEHYWPYTNDLFDTGVELDILLWRNNLEKRLTAFGVNLPDSMPEPTSRKERSPEILALMENVIKPAQSVFRLDPNTVWA
jgi:1,2-phenylacetyl-CoA epoxidase catalytic subunit